jgi:hypothetical protein
MLAKLTSKNQLTLPKSAVQAVGQAQYFDVAVREGQIVLTPVRIQRADAVRAKLSALGLAEADVTDAVRWARVGATASTRVAEPQPTYAAARKASATPGKKATRRAR